jgi:PleD family two-component response regulator
MELERSKMQHADRRLTLLCVRDISERKAQTEALEHQALHDALTGLANRTLFSEHLARARRTECERPSADSRPGSSIRIGIEPVGCIYSIGLGLTQLPCTRG